jgi:hypothetical protein
MRCATCGPAHLEYLLLCRLLPKSVIESKAPLLPHQHTAPASIHADAGLQVAAAAAGEPSESPAASCMHTIPAAAANLVAPPCPVRVRLPAPHQCAETPPEPACEPSRRSLAISGLALSATLTQVSSRPLPPAADAAPAVHTGLLVPRGLIIEDEADGERRGVLAMVVARSPASRTMQHRMQWSRAASRQATAVSCKPMANRQSCDTMARGSRHGDGIENVRCRD